MENPERIGLDKFQVVCNHMSAAIMLYMHGEHPAMVIAHVHPAFDILHNLETRYAKDGRINSVAFWSAEIDRQRGTNHFAKFIPGEGPGYYRRLGNFVKHADKDSYALMNISDQDAYEYLFATLKDFHILKDVLKGADELSLNERHKKAALKLKDRHGLKRIFGQVADFLTYMPYAPLPKIDLLSDMFFAWQSVVEHRTRKAFLDYKQEFHDMSKVKHFNVMDRFVMFRGMADNLFDLNAEMIRVGLKKRLIGMDEKELNLTAYDVQSQCKTLAREGARARVLYKTIKELNKVQWDGAGYYLSHDEVEPVDHKYEAHDHGFDMTGLIYVGK